MMVMAGLLTMLVILFVGERILVYLYVCNHMYINLEKGHNNVGRASHF